MIESLFKQGSTLARLQSGPLAQQLPLIAEALHKEQYPPETVRRYVRVADAFGRWLEKHGLRIAETDETTLARYRAGTVGCRTVNFAPPDAGWQRFLRCSAHTLR